MSSSHHPSTSSSSSSSRSCEKGLKHVPESLLDKAAKIVAFHIPFVRIEDRYERIPEPVQRRIIYWSFPRNEQDICMYSSVSNVCYGNYSIKNVLQVGFNLSGNVAVRSPPSSSNPVTSSSQSNYGSQSNCVSSSSETEKSYRVSITFDRCKITSVTCTCDAKDIFWCQHVVALALYRIKNPHLVKLRVPISETLASLNKVQLQKLLQYMIAEHHTEVLSTAQKLADEILQYKSVINTIAGAPDPTSGPVADAPHTWHLYEDQVSEQVRSYLNFKEITTASANLNPLFQKVKEMLKAKDSNAPRLLQLITEQFMTKHPTWEAYRETYTWPALWNRLAALWVCVVLNPHGTNADRHEWKALLTKWSAQPTCPLEDYEPRSTFQVAGQSKPRSIFQRAIDACNLPWNDDQHLQYILDHDSHPTNASFSHPNRLTSLAAARVKTLRCQGYREESLKLAVAIVRKMKRQLYSARSSIQPQSKSDEWIGWIGWISSLFNTLANASLTNPPPTFPPNSTRSDPVFGPDAGPILVKKKPKYRHVHVPGSPNENESYLTLALEAALIGLGQQRLFPRNKGAEEYSFAKERKLIAKLKDIDLDSSLVHVLKKQAKGLLNGGPFSGLGIGIHNESFPMHTFSKYLFKAILPYDEDLAYQIGLRAMRLPILERNEPDETSMGIIARYPRLQHLTIEHMQRQQCILAATMLEAAKDDMNRLKEISETAKRSVQCSSHLFQLAQNSLKVAVPLPDMSVRYEKLMYNALDIGLHVMKITLFGNTYRRDMINWLVDCAMAVGHDALVTIMINWSSYFTPVEATSQVAQVIMSNTAHTRLSLTYTESDFLSCHARALAIDCLMKDPPGCALNVFQLCESNLSDFNKAYAIVQAAGANGIMNPGHLFSVAKYMDTRQSNGSKRAYRLALLGVKGIHIPYNEDNHPQISEIHWTCQMALNLGKNELAELVPILVHNIQCAPVLTDVLRRCSPFTPSGLPGYSHHHSYGKKRSHSSASSSAQTYCHPKTMLVDKAPLRLLLDAAIAAYVNTTHSRLTHISPRHYGDFIEFLSKARETFMLAPDGLMQFANLVENMKMVYKGKKKLMFLVKERFG